MRESFTTDTIIKDNGNILVAGSHVDVDMSPLEESDTQELMERTYETIQREKNAHMNQYYNERDSYEPNYNQNIDLYDSTVEENS